MSEPDLQALEDWIGPLLEKLTPAERRHLARTIARDLRKSQRERIKSQQNPDGSQFEARSELRSQSSGIRRRAMFRKLPTARYMKMRTGPGAASVAFMGRVARIAKVHQHGLRDRVERGGPMHNYPRRELLGFTRADRERIRDQLIDHLT